MDEFSGNSNKSKEKRQELEKVTHDAVVRGETKSRKKSSVKKFVEDFFADDITSVKDYIIFDVILPNLKDGLWDIIDKGSHRLIFGDGGSGRRHDRSHNERRRYDKISNGYSSLSEERSRRRSRNEDCERCTDNEMWYQYRDDAERVRDKLLDTFDEYQQVSRAALLEFSKLDTEIADFKYGWDDLTFDNTRIEPARGGGYLLKLPRPIKL